MSYKYCAACEEKIHIHQSSHYLHVFEANPSMPNSKGFRVTPFAHVCDRCEIQQNFSALFLDVFFDLMPEYLFRQKDFNLAANDPLYNMESKPDSELVSCSFCKGHIPNVESILAIWRHDIAWSQDPNRASSMIDGDIMRVEDLLIACHCCSKNLDLHELACEAAEIVMYMLNEIDPSEDM